MTPSEFEQLLERYVKGLATPTEIKKIEVWYERMGQNSTSLDDQRSAQKRKERSLYTIIDGTKPHGIRSHRKKILLGISAVAASLLLVFIYSRFFVSTPAHLLTSIEENLSNAQSRTFSEPVVYENRSKEGRLIVLEDGSSVVLLAGSQLTLLPGFGIEHRKTELNGHAFFEIFPDAKLPFYVFCEEVVTRVVGTSFWIKSSPLSSMVEVLVKTGEVSVYKKEVQEEHKYEDSVTLVADQKATFPAKATSEEAWMALTSRESIAPEGPQDLYIFQNSPITAVLGSISKEYGLKMDLNTARLEGCTFTGDLSELSLLEKLDIISFSTGINYDASEGLITVTSNGCL
jgi:transmembrane sensor